MSDDPSALSLAKFEDLADALAFALRFEGRKRVHNADELMSAIVAKRLVEHLERSGFVVMKRPPTGGAAALAVVMGADDVAMAPTPPGCPLAGAGRRGGAQGARAGVPVIFLTHLRPNCARSLQFAAGVRARGFKIAAEAAYVLTVGKSRASRCDCHSSILTEMKSQQLRQT